MIITKPYKANEDFGLRKVITFSTEGLKIKKIKPKSSRSKREEIYDYAIDLESVKYEYEETDQQVNHVIDIMMEEMADFNL